MALARALCVCAFLSMLGTSTMQVVPGPGPNYREGVYIPPNPGDANYRTYIHNDRRYGSAFPANYNPFDPYARDPFPNRNPFDAQNPQGVFNPNYFNPDPNRVNQPVSQYKTLKIKEFNIIILFIILLYHISVRSAIGEWLNVIFFYGSFKTNAVRKGGFGVVPPLVCSIAM